MVIPCLKLRDQIAEKIKQKVEILKKGGIMPSFAIILIGDDPSSITYVRVKSKKAQELGIKTQVFKFQITNSKFRNISKNPLEIRDYQNTQQKDIEELIEKLNTDPSIHGIIIQRPLPPGFDEDQLQSLIDPKKDIDGLSKNSPFQNPLVLAVSHVVNYVLSVGDDLLVIPHTNRPGGLSLQKNLNLVVIGKGRSGGAPIFNYFSSHPIISLPTTHYNLQTILVDTKTPNPTEILQNTDIVISCVGKDRIVNAGNIKKGVVLISVGQHIRENPLEIRKNPGDTKTNKWTGDYNEQEIANIAGFYTRTPGGIGPLNVIFLLQNVLTSSQTL